MKMGKVLPASWSSMEGYITCPKQFYETRILKNWKQEETPEMDWGNRSHKALENNVKFDRPLPSNMTQYQWVLNLLAKRKPDSVIHAELEVGCTIDKEPAGFWDDDCYVRARSTCWLTTWISLRR